MKNIILFIALCLLLPFGAAAEGGRRVVAEPYCDLGVLAARLKTSRYNPFENPTGLFFRQGDEIMLTVGDTKGRKLELVLVDWSRPASKDGKKEETSRYTLATGENRFTAKNKGLAYISYYTEDYKEAPAVECLFASGTWNGLFDPQIHSDADWEKMLNETVFDVIDIRGKYVQLTFDVEALRRHCPRNGTEMIGLYDQIILWEQELIGLDQFGHRTNNRMFGRSSWFGPPNANGKGVSFPSVAKIVNPEDIRRSNWVIGHEFGHVNQVRPGLKWHGTTEITTNIFSCWVQYKLTPQGPLRLEHSMSGNGAGGKEIGGTFNWHFNHSVVGGKPLFYQPVATEKGPWADNKNPFVRLCPFWQLQLYNAVAGCGVPDFYARMSQQVRETDEKRLSAGQLQLNFVRNACDVMKQDMTGFFTQCGMLRPVDGKIGDYGGERDMVITAEQIEAVRQYASRYPEPQSPVICYITANSAEAFRKRLSVKGKEGKGVKLEGEKCVISHKDWKNVVVFEAYRGKELRRVTMTGTGTADNSSTAAVFPEDCDSLMAVAWDGKRTPVIRRKKL